MQGIKESSIMETCQGAILEKLDVETGKVIRNILDPNTKAKAKRSITIKIDLTPTEDRNSVIVTSSCISKLVPSKPVETTLYVDERDGKPIAIETAPQIAGQLDVEGNFQQENKIIKLA